MFILFVYIHNVFDTSRANIYPIEPVNNKRKRQRRKSGIKSQVD